MKRKFNPCMVITITPFSWQWKPQFDDTSRVYSISWLFFMIEVYMN